MLSYNIDSQRKRKIQEKHTELRMYLSVLTSSKWSNKTIKKKEHRKAQKQTYGGNNTIIVLHRKVSNSRLNRRKPPRKHITRQPTSLGIALKPQGDKSVTLHRELGPVPSLRAGPCTTSLGQPESVLWKEHTREV